MSATEAREAAQALSGFLHEHPEQLTLDARLALLVLASTINQIDPPATTAADHPEAALIFRKTFCGDD
jgi:hypothetical protein